MQDRILPLLQVRHTPLGKTGAWRCWFCRWCLRWYEQSIRDFLGIVYWWVFLCGLSAEIRGSSRLETECSCASRFLVVKTCRLISMNTPQVYTVMLHVVVRHWIYTTEFLISYLGIPCFLYQLVDAIWGMQNRHLSQSELLTFKRLMKRSIHTRWPFCMFSQHDIHVQHVCILHLCKRVSSWMV